MQSQQLNLIVSKAKRALATVTTLTIRLPPSCNNSSLPVGDPYGISALVGILPAARCISIHGSIDPALLQQLGPLIDDFFFSAPGMHRVIVENLHELLPRLKVLRIAGYTRELFIDPMHPMMPYNLIAMAGVEHLQVDELFVDSEVLWTSFPPNIRQLMCAGLTCAPPVTTSLHQLRIVNLTGGASTLAVLAGLFRLVPSLVSVKTSGDRIHVDSGFKSRTPPTEMYLASMVADLITLNDKHNNGFTSQPYFLDFDNCRHLLDIFKVLPLLSSVGKVRLRWIQDDDWHGNHSTADTFALFKNIFPNVKSLNFFGNKMITDRTLMSLLPLHRMESLTLTRCNKVTSTGLTFLITQLPCFTFLDCDTCQRFTPEDAQLLTEMLQAIDRDVHIKGFSTSSYDDIFSDYDDDVE